MSLSPHLTYVQVLLASIEDVTKKNSNFIRVDVPLSSQVSLTPLDMVKLGLEIDVNMGQPMPIGVIKKEMSLNQMATALLDSTGIQRECPQGVFAQ